jgi:hypothetical protein
MVPVWKGSPGTNALAYSASWSVTKEKKFNNIDDWLVTEVLVVFGFTGFAVAYFVFKHDLVSKLSNFLRTLFTNFRKKLECLSLVSFSSLVKCLLVKSLSDDTL